MRKKLKLLANKDNFESSIRVLYYVYRKLKDVTNNPVVLEFGANIGIRTAFLAEL